MENPMNLKVPSKWGFWGPFFVVCLLGDVNS